MAKVLEILECLGQVKEYTLKRQTSPNTFEYGQQKEGEFTSQLITASVQPMSGNEILEEFSGGERLRDTVIIYTEVELRTVNPKTGYKADRVFIKDCDYEVQKVECWDQQAEDCLNHYKSYATRMNIDEVKSDA